MMNPIFLTPLETQYFNLNQVEYYQEDQQQLELLPTSPYFPSNQTMSDHHSLLASEQLKASQNIFFNEESPSYGAQITSTNNHDQFIFKDPEGHEPNSLSGGGYHTAHAPAPAPATDNRSSLRWMSSKIRMMRKMISPRTDPMGGSMNNSSSNIIDHGPQFGLNDETNGYNNNAIRVCSDCKTTKTPLWRSGPQGPKSLCNACGIRQRKARKAAMEAAAAMATDSCCEASSSTSTKTKIKLKINKDKKRSRTASNNNNICVSQSYSNKKQTPTCSKEQANDQLADSDQTNSSSSIRSISKRQLCFEELCVKLLRENAAFHRLFPRDEEEGALLLMTLSFGLTDQS